MGAKPLYNDGWQASVLMKETTPSSVSSFKGVTSRVFPLKADLRCLQNLCDKYYNFVPPSVAQFRPVFPYVQLSIIHYAKMTPGGSSEGISQNEIAFVIPVEWRREENGRSVFVDWASLIPFIFVDDDISLMFGREVYGWPKIIAQVEKDLDPWIIHPRAPTELMTASTAGYFSTSTRSPEKLKQLLEITLDPSPIALQVRPDPNQLGMLLDGPQRWWESMAMMWDGFSALAGGMSSGTPFLFDWQAQAQMMAMNLRRAGSSWTDVPRELLWGALFPGVPPQQVAEKLGVKRPVANVPPLNQINVKQFRDAADPTCACYQALVNSQINIVRMENIGLLGDLNVLYGDPTGGFKVRWYSKDGSKNADGVYQDTGEMILRELGLEEAERQAVGESVDRTFVSTLKPFYPFWNEMELQYGNGKNLCWRAHAGQWQVGDETSSSLPRRGQPTPSAQAAENLPRFISVMGGALTSDDDAGAPHASEDEDLELSAGYAAQTAGEIQALLNVYPLQADRKKLVEFCDKYFNNLNFSNNNLGRPQAPIVPQVAAVYLIALSQRAAGKGWFLREVGFYVPVLWPTEEGQTMTALVAPFVYSESEIDAIIDRELNGRATQDGILTFPRRGQEEFNRQDEARPLPLLSVRTEVVQLGQAGEADKTGQLFRLDYRAGQSPARPVEEDASVEALRAAFRSGSLKSLALKQFPDAEDYQYACYQALVASTWKMDGAVTVQNIDGERLLRLYKLEYPKIADTLGLVPLSEPGDQGNEPFVTFPTINPFSVEIEKQVGWEDCKNIYWRAGGVQWQVEDANS